jgi:hypothetical protein
VNIKSDGRKELQKEDYDNIVSLANQGVTKKEIARRMKIAVGTVTRCLNRLAPHLETQSRNAEVLEKAARRGNDAPAPEPGPVPAVVASMPEPAPAAVVDNIPTHTVQVSGAAPIVTDFNLSDARTLPQAQPAQHGAAQYGGAAQMSGGLSNAEVEELRKATGMTIAEIESLLFAGLFAFTPDASQKEVLVTAWKNCLRHVITSQNQDMTIAVLLLISAHGAIFLVHKDEVMAAVKKWQGKKDDKKQTALPVGSGDMLTEDEYRAHEKAEAERKPESESSPIGFNGTPR